MRTHAENKKRLRSTSSSGSGAAPPTHKKTESVPVSASTDKQSALALTANAELKPCHNAFVVVGTYHSVMAGLVLKKDKFFIKFSIKHHVGSLNRVAVSGKYMASCGVDELVFLFTNKAEKNMTPALRAKLAAVGEPVAMRLADLGSLTPPSEITCLAFAGTGAAGASQYLLCGGADGQLLVYRTRDWSLALTLPVHERGLVDMAVHPLSGGALLVTVGADRVIAVLDLSKGRLMTKWKYTSEKPKPETAAEPGMSDDDDENADGDDESQGDSGSSGSESDSEHGGGLEAGEGPLYSKPRAQRLQEAQQLKAREAQTQAAADQGTAPVDIPARRAKVSPLILRQQREDPSQVCFSPRGTYFAVLSRFSVVVYATATMRRHVGFRYPRMMPAEELHTAHFVSEDILLIGNESGALLFFHVPQEAAHAPKEAEADDDAVLPVTVSVVFPEPVQAEAAALWATPIDLTVETRKKNPLRHVSRIKSICREGSTVFTMDSHGILMAWDASVTTPTRRAESPTVTLRYRTSANCQGRVTSMSTMSL